MASLTSSSSVCVRCASAPGVPARLLPGIQKIVSPQPSRQTLWRSQQHHARGSVRVYSKNDVGSAIDGVIDAVRPGFIPRPVAKGLLAFLTFSFVVSLVQKLLSAALFFGVLAGAGFLFFKSQTAGGNK